VSQWTTCEKCGAQFVEHAVVETCGGVGVLYERPEDRPATGVCRDCREKRAALAVLAEKMGYRLVPR
jgi:hypothetical protein